jgi:hypothetical protein
MQYVLDNSSNRLFLKNKLTFCRISPWITESPKKIKASTFQKSFYKTIKSSMFATTSVEVEDQDNNANFREMASSMT